MVDNRTERQRASIGAYRTHVQIEEVVRALGRAGYNMKKISVVAKGRTDERALGLYTNGDRMKACGGPGSFWGGLWEHLGGAAFLWVPGTGPVAVAGPFADKFVDAVQAAEVMGRSSAVSAALAGLGLPTDRLVEYESLLNDGKYLLIAHGSLEEIRRALAIMQTSSISAIEMNAA